MLDGTIALAFTAGMIATFNPCGFAMLPAYLSTFLGLEERSGDLASRILRAFAVATALTAGFVVVFGVLGFGLSWIEETFSVQVERNLPYVTIVIGVALVGLGIALLAGRKLTVALPRFERGGQNGELLSMFVFGISYAIASLSCTLPIFLSVVTGTFDRDGVLEGVWVYVAYALGMGLVLTVLTLLMALAKASMVHSMRRALPYVDRVAGGLLVLAGAYVAYYGWYELQVFSGNLEAGGPAEYFFSLNDDLEQWVDDVGATNIGLVLGAVVLGALIVSIGVRADRRWGRLGAGAGPPDADAGPPDAGAGRLGAGAGPPDAGAGPPDAGDGRLGAGAGTAPAGGAGDDEG